MSVGDVCEMLDRIYIGSSFQDSKLLDYEDGIHSHHMWICFEYVQEIHFLSVHDMVSIGFVYWAWKSCLLPATHI